MTPLTQAANEFSAWLDKRQPSLNSDQLRQAEFVKLSFRTIEMNKNANAKAAAMRHHAQDVAKLAAIL